MHSAQSALNTLCNPNNEVSAHYLIGRDGTTFRLVDEAKRAWHAGAGRWGNVEDVNSHSIGIELDNDGFSPFSEPLMASLEALLVGIKHRWSIESERIIGHSDMAPSRKIDPGARFDWKRLARQGLSVWPEECETDLGFVNAMQRFGYTASDDPDVLLQCFRLRFAPWRIGPICDADRTEINSLAQRFPVDARNANA